MDRVFRRVLTETVLRPIKKPIWYAVHALTGIRIQTTAHYLDATMFSASFKAPLDKICRILPSLKLVPAESSPGFATIVIAANDFRHIDILYPYKEVAIMIPIFFKMKREELQSAGLWYMHLPVSTEDARWPGVENYGFPKFVADITIDSDVPECRLTHRGHEILSLRVKKTRTQFEQWELNNVTKRNEEYIYSTFSVEGERGISETKGGGSLSLGNHEIGKELRDLQIDLSSFRHEYVPKADAVLIAGKEVLLE